MRFNSSFPPFDNYDPISALTSVSVKPRSLFNLRLALWGLLTSLASDQWLGQEQLCCQQQPLHHLSSLKRSSAAEPQKSGKYSHLEGVRTLQEEGQ